MPKIVHPGTSKVFELISLDVFEQLKSKFNLTLKRKA